MPDAMPSYLFQHQLPIYPHRRLSVLLAVLSQPAAHLPHPLQAISSVQQILNILRHDLGDIFQLIVQLVQIRARSAILVGLLRPLDEGVKFNKSVWS